MNRTQLKPGRSLAELTRAERRWVRGVNTVCLINKLRND